FHGRVAYFLSNTAVRQNKTISFTSFLQNELPFYPNHPEDQKLCQKMLSRLHDFLRRSYSVWLTACWRIEKTIRKFESCRVQKERSLFLFLIRKKGCCS